MFVMVFRKITVSFPIGHVLHPTRPTKQGLGIIELDTFYTNLCLCSRPVVDETVCDDDDASSFEHSLDVTQTRPFHPSWLKHLHELNVGDHHGSTGWFGAKINIIGDVKAGLALGELCSTPPLFGEDCVSYIAKALQLSDGLFWLLNFASGCVWEPICVQSLFRLTQKPRSVQNIPFG